MIRAGYVRPSVPVGTSLPGALRRLRDALQSPLAADLIAGVPIVASHDLERLADAIMAAHFEAHELVDVARGARVMMPEHEVPGTVRHCFDVMQGDALAKCIVVTAPASDTAGARIVALSQIAHEPGTYLARESRTLPIPAE